jgi:hypothetical protein
MDSRSDCQGTQTPNTVELTCRSSKIEIDNCHPKEDRQSPELEDIPSRRESAELELFVMEDVTEATVAQTLPEQMDEILDDEAKVKQESGGISVPRTKPKPGQCGSVLKMNDKAVLDQLAATDGLKRAWHAQEAKQVYWRLGMKQWKG